MVIVNTEVAPETIAMGAKLWLISAGKVKAYAEVIGNRVTEKIKIMDKINKRIDLDIGYISPPRDIIIEQTTPANRGAVRQSNTSSF